MLNLGIRRFALSMVIATLAFASCVKDTLKETNNGSAIDFRVAAQTRAVELTGANIESFYVTARTSDAVDNYFTDAQYVKTVDESFRSNTPYYWPSIGELEFFAYAPSLGKFGSDAKLAVGETSQKITGFSVDPDISDQKDFITAVTTATRDNSVEGVELIFEHKLSQIEVRAKNLNAGYNYSIKGVKIYGVALKADFNFSPTEGQPEWEIVESATTTPIYEYYNSAKTLGNTPVSVMGPGGNAMLIPQELTKWDKDSKKGAYIAVYTQIKTAEGAMVFPRLTSGSDAYDWILVPIDTNWEAGYKYIYTLDFSSGAGMDENGVDVLGEPIEFALEIEQWSENTPIDLSPLKYYLNGSWEVYQVQSYRDYNEGYEVDKQWPEEDLYDTEEELSTEEKVSQALRRVRVKDDTYTYIYPGKEEQQLVPYWITDGYFCFPNNKGGIESYYIVYIDSNEFIIKYEGDENTRYHLTKIYYYKRVKDGFPLLAEKEAVLTTGMWELTSCLYSRYDTEGILTEEGQIDWSDPENGADPSVHFLRFSDNKVYFNTEEEMFAEMEDNYSKFVINDDETFYIDRLTFFTMRLKITYYILVDGEVVGTEVVYPFYTKVN